MPDAVADLGPWLVLIVKERARHLVLPKPLLEFVAAVVHRAGIGPIVHARHREVKVLNFLIMLRITTRGRLQQWRPAD